MLGAGTRGTLRPNVATPAVRLTPESSGTDALLQAVSATNPSIAWVSGHAATFVRTLDGGAHWQPVVMPAADSLEFRDVEAFGADTAYLLSSGSGDRSRIYRTTDGGARWTVQYVSHDSAAFFDCLAFWDANHGIAVSDAVHGRFVLLTTTDGATWNPVPDQALPAALPGEGSFAASGTCVVTRAPGDAWVVTGSAPNARLLHTSDRGRTWSVVTTPVPSGPARGLTTVAVRDARHLVVLGGPISSPTAREDEVAITDDGGRTWMPGGRLPFGGAVYGAAFTGDGSVLIAVGPGGAALSTDDGRRWRLIDSAAYWSVGFANANVGWAVGPHGRITRLDLVR